ncbi:TraB/GumN family protein [Rhodanobacter sp. DHB23]|uniref:TraB/GumN family protein n=1 Tax=Rhodanobacter sp. DHB23 TaxID=2775923 RepID=UPI00177D5461|nr:TraB/GumN family protein [Rhodanobacter sp. DHB23]MBD8872704.1 TraB/GumN family protein [Rhodanobacter sp. DHB23]
MRPWIMLLGFALAAPAAFGAQAQVPPSAGTTATPPVPAEVPLLAPVVVSGVVSGPGLWKVSRDGHVLWVLGTLSPLPGNMQWESHEVEQVLAQSKQVLLQPKIELKADVGFFGKLFLLPSAYGARKNPDGKSLDQVMDASTYARWLVLKRKYIGNDGGIERWRPLFAAEELYNKALKGNGLNRDGGVPGKVAALAKQDGVVETPVRYRVEIRHPRDAIKAFKAAAPSDMECFDRTLDAIEHDLPAMTARANAWATGDLEALRALPDSHRHDTCVAAVTGAGFARQFGMADIPAQLEAAWLAAARDALAKNDTSFAMLPMDELLSPDGYLARLKAQGYAVEAPLGLDDAPAAGGSVAAPVSAAAH